MSGPFGNKDSQRFFPSPLFEARQARSGGAAARRPVFLLGLGLPPRLESDTIMLAVLFFCGGNAGASDHLYGPKRLSLGLSGFPPPFHGA